MADSSSPTQVTWLTGPDNFGSWLRDFQVAADEKEVWDLFTGRERVIPEPDFALMMCGTEAEGEEMTKPEVDILFVKYTIAVDAWKDNRKRIKIGRNLIINSVHPVMRDEIRGKPPKEALSHLKKMYKLDDTRARKIVETSFANLKFDPTKPVMTFVNSLRLLQKDITGSQGVCTDTQIMNKVIHSLPRDRFGAFFADNSILGCMCNGDPIKITEFMARLVFVKAFLPPVSV